MKLSTVSAAALALALTAGSAFAADLPSHKAPPYIPPPPPPLWTGFYVGLNAGYTFSDSNQVWTNGFPIVPGGFTAADSAAAAFSVSTLAGAGNTGGFIGGGQVGYNWQFMNNLLVGVEADIQGIASSSSATTVVGAGAGVQNFVSFTDVRKNLDYIGTVRGRLGWLFTPTLLVYGTGGLAYGGVSVNSNFATFEQGFGQGFGTAAFADTRVGWTAGGGLEWMFMPNWSAKVEYLYYDLGSATSAGTVVVDNGAGAGGAVDWAYGAGTRARFNGHIIRAGVNYHFNWAPPPAPVLAKY